MDALSHPAKIGPRGASGQRRELSTLSMTQGFPWLFR
jgi:hypothetical protein